VEGLVLIYGCVHERMLLRRFLFTKESRKGERGEKYARKKGRKVCKDENSCFMRSLREGRPEL
jgi:hypothetical protein